ncbi:MAG: YcnI family protein [Hyphomicrobiaceae bacterium]|nr:YcnI family protein [Hyphomicrobiaceae bacterium]
MTHLDGGAPAPSSDRNETSSVRDTSPGSSRQTIRPGQGDTPRQQTELSLKLTIVNPSRWTAMTLLRFSALLVFAATLQVAPAGAHVTVEPKSALPGPIKMTFRVPHGCQGSRTTALQVAIPEGIIGVKPAPKPGWSVSMARGSHARAYDYFHGRTESEGVKEVVWSGGDLADEYFDEFALIGFVTDAYSPGDRVIFKVSQICKEGRLDWVEIPDAARGTHSAYPAPVMTILEASGHSGHH